jgi:hypothetical protein
MCTALGWTWQHVETELDLYRIDAFYRAWRRTPPAAWLLRALASAYGWKPLDEARAAEPVGVRSEAAEAGDLIEALRGE